MTLETENLPPIEDPSHEAIEAALRELGDGFAILSRMQNDYVQVTAGGDGGFLLERQDGSPDRHYQTRDKSIPLAAIVVAFRGFSEGDSSWADELEWEPLTW